MATALRPVAKEAAGAMVGSVVDVSSNLAVGAALFDIASMADRETH
jgi:hypothetical protein